MKRLIQHIIPLLMVVFICACSKMRTDANSSKSMEPLEEESLEMVVEESAPVVAPEYDINHKQIEQRLQEIIEYKQLIQANPSFKEQISHQLSKVLPTHEAFTVDTDRPIKAKNVSYNSAPTIVNDSVKTFVFSFQLNNRPFVATTTITTTKVTIENELTNSQRIVFDSIVAVGNN